MIFTRINDVILEKIEDASDEPKRAGHIRPCIKQRNLDPSYYAHLSSGEVIRCHNRVTAEFYIRNESRKIQ